MNLTFLESILDAIDQMTEKHEDIEDLLKTYFTAGVTPEFAEKYQDTDALTGEIILSLFGFLLNLRHYSRSSKYCIR